MQRKMMIYFYRFLLGISKLTTSFSESLKSEWSLGSSAQLTYLHAIGDLIDFRKANGTTPDILQHFVISEIYLTRGKKYLAKQKKLEWNRDLDLDSLIAVNSLATLEEMDQVIPFHLDRFKDVVRKCKAFPIDDVPFHDLTFATRFVATFLFIEVKGAPPMTFQYLTVSMFEASKLNEGFIDQKEFKTNVTFTFDSLLFDELSTRVVDLYINSVRPLLNPKCDYLLLTRNGTQYKKLGGAMCKLVCSAIGKYIHPTRFRQVVETESASKSGLEDQKISV